MTAADDRLESHWRLAFPSKYLNAADLRGQDVTVRIESIGKDDLPLEGTSDKKASVLIAFEGAGKKLVANKTNLETIASIHGNYMADWIGKEIVLCSTRKELFGRRKGKAIKDPGTRRITDAVRVRPGKAGAADETTNDAADEPQQEQTA